MGCDKFSLIVLKVREDQEKRRIEEEQQGQLVPAQQPGQQSSTEAPQSQPVLQSTSYVPPQPNQHSSPMVSQPQSQQSLPSTNYNTPQPAQMTGMPQGFSYVPQSIGHIPVQGQSVVAVQPESEESEADQQPHATGGVYLKYNRTLLQLYLQSVA